MSIYSWPVFQTVRGHQLVFRTKGRWQQDSAQFENSIFGRIKMWASIFVLTLYACHTIIRKASEVIAYRLNASTQEAPVAIESIIYRVSGAELNSAEISEAFKRLQHAHLDVERLQQCSGEWNQCSMIAEKSVFCIRMGHRIASTARKQTGRQPIRWCSKRILLQATL